METGRYTGIYMAHHTGYSNLYLFHCAFYRFLYIPHWLQVYRNRYDYIKMFNPSALVISRFHSLFMLFYFWYDVLIRPVFVVLHPTKSTKTFWPIYCIYVNPDPCQVIKIYLYVTYGNINACF